MPMLEFSPSRLANIHTSRPASVSNTQSVVGKARGFGRVCVQTTRTYATTPNPGNQFIVQPRYSTGYAALHKEVRYLQLVED